MSERFVTMHGLDGSVCGAIYHSSRPDTEAFGHDGDEIEIISSETIAFYLNPDIDTDFDEIPINSVNVLSVGKDRGKFKEVVVDFGNGNIESRYISIPTIDF